MSHCRHFPSLYIFFLSSFWIERVDGVRFSHIFAWDRIWISNPFLVCHEINQYVRVNVLSLCKIRSIWTMSHWTFTLFIIYSVNRNRLGYGPTRKGRLWVSMGKSLPEKLKLQVTKINYNHFGVRFGNFNLIWPLRPSRELDHHGSHTVIPRTRTRISISLRDCTKLIFFDEHKKSHQKAIS